ncbi:MAG TPA: hypothetical protein VK459_28445 [Polyangiaceae bacterium]|nr:hypothetical protein [Polyangiaceae bacterium]
MTRYGYSFVSDKGFVAFAHDLSEGAWKDISITKYDVPDRMPALSLLEAPRPVVWKLRATWAIATLREILGGASEEALAQLDGDWDSAQRKLYYHLGGASEDKDTGKRGAAERLRGALLRGGGTAQTTMGYDDEVDFGRHQLAILKGDPLAADAKKVGLAAVVKQIEESTEALAKALGRGPGQKRSSPRSIRLREALTECSAAFNWIHQDLAWTAEHTPPGAARTQIDNLLAPLTALLSRFPPTSGAKGGATAEDEEVDAAAGGGEAAGKGTVELPA